MNTTNGKIAVQSRRRMMDALLRIMEVYDYREITVTQIVQEAGISRNTFYRLFSHKDEILALIFDELFDEFFLRIRQAHIESFWLVMETYFDFWEQHRPLLLLLQKNQLLQRVLEQSYEKSDQIFRLVHARDTTNPSALPLPYLLAFSVGGMHHMLMKWVACGMTVPARTLIAQLRSCLLYDGLPGVMDVPSRADMESQDSIK